MAGCGPEEGMVETGQFTFISTPHTKGKIKHERLAQLNERNYFQFTANVIDTDVLIQAGSAMD